MHAFYEFKGDMYNTLKLSVGSKKTLQYFHIQRLHLNDLKTTFASSED